MYIAVMGSKRLTQQDDELRNKQNVKYFTEHEGKEHFYNRLNYIFETFLNSECDSLLVIPNDVYLIDFETIERLSKYDGKVFNLINDGRGNQFGGVLNESNIIDNNVECGWLEPAFVVNRATLEKVGPLGPNKPRESGSGVPWVLSKAFREAGVEMFKPMGDRGYLFHGTHDSDLNPIERLRHPLITISTKQRIVLAIATTKDRRELLSYTLGSLEGQTVQPDKVLVYENEGDGLGLTDNAKFKYHNEPCDYYLTCDDGMIYPSDYIASLVSEIEKNGGEPVSYHGRRLKRKGIPYYQGHDMFGCLRRVESDALVDILGTGVMGFSPKVMQGIDFNSIVYNEKKRMSDILFAYEWALKRKAKPLKVLSHESGWIQEVHYDNCIFQDAAKNNFKTPIQDKLADELFEIIIDSRANS